MATLRSQGDLLLVVREVSAPLPNLRETKDSLSRAVTLPRKGGLHANVAVISQSIGESGHDFVARVLSHVERDQNRGTAYRAAVIATGPDISEGATAMRAQLAASLAAVLAPRPNAVLTIHAPVNASEGTQAHLFELMESTARGAANLAIRLSFPANSPKSWSTLVH